MTSTVNAARKQLQAQYQPLRAKILSYYTLLLLVGLEAAPAARQLPSRLGHWRAHHSEAVRSVAPALESLVQRIEALLPLRGRDVIKAAHVPRKSGGRRKHTVIKVQLNPGEWPPRYK